jgi:hypothetical protein
VLLVPITVTVSGRFDLEFKLESNDNLVLSPGGVQTSASWYASVKYNGQLSTDYGKNIEFGLVKPFYDWPVDGSVQARLLMKTKLHTSGAAGALAIPVIFTLMPTLRGTFSKSPCSSSYISISSSYRLDLSIGVDSIIVAGSSYTLGGTLPYSKSLEIIGWKPFTLLSSTGCVNIGIVQFSSWRRQLAGPNADGGSAAACAFNESSSSWSCEYITNSFGPCSTVCANFECMIL